MRFCITEACFMLGCLPKIRDNLELRHSNNEGVAGSVERVSGRHDCWHDVGRCEEVIKRLMFTFSARPLT